MIPQKLVIIILAITLAVVFVWFVIIDNYIIPSIISENQQSFQNGYETGSNDIIIGIIQQSYSCTPISLWSENVTVQVINVECLQKDVSDNIP